LKFQVRNLTRASLLGDSIDIADDRAKRNTGLLKHTRLEPGHGLWIVPCEAIHMFFMKFPIDVVYIDRKHRVRKVVRALRPWKMSMCITAHSVIELPVGVIDETQTQKGDQLELVGQLSDLP
jgi:hypothetical protein